MNIAFTSTPAKSFARFLHDNNPVAISFSWREYYLPQAPEIELLAVFGVDCSGEKQVLVTNRIGQAAVLLEETDGERGFLDVLSLKLEAPLIGLESAWKLEAISIPKPWGQEIWYTGIEARGQSGVTDGRFRVPLPWVLALAPDILLAPGCREPNLVKILDPLEEEVFGDLYFELHEQKQEVYVVTNISTTAWPQGKGAIRYGFDPQVRQQYSDDEMFRRDYLAAVKNYEKVRRAIDKILDGFRNQEGAPLSAPVSADKLKVWLDKVPGDLRTQEKVARDAMNAFTYMVPLSTGDVVRVARRTPHSLQHGVRTIEFQTPVYERKILNFAQKVLTQDQWDTDEGVEIMSLEPGSVEALPVCAEGADYILEKVVEFDDFEVYRLQLSAGGEYWMQESDHYKVLFVVSGELSLGSQILRAENATLIPGTSQISVIRNTGVKGAIGLISVPRL